MYKANYKYEFLKTYRSIQTFLKGEQLDRVYKHEDDDLGMYFLYAYYYDYKKSTNRATNFWRYKNAVDKCKLKRAHSYTIIVATTAHNLELDEVKISLVKHINTKIFPYPFWLVHK